MPDDPDGSEECVCGHALDEHLEEWARPCDIHGCGCIEFEYDE